jgi:molybdopterin-guanine dinucleotide biosynthesis protein B
MILGIYGYQDSGKTTVVEGLVSDLVGRGYTVSTIKHTTHDIGPGEAGKDTSRHAGAGADPVVLLSGEGAVVSIASSMGIERVVEMIRRGFSPDVVLIEGLKDGPYRKVSMGDIEPRDDTVMSNPSVEELADYVEGEVRVERMLASLPGLDCGKCGMDCLSLARKVLGGEMTREDCRELSDIDVTITVGGRRIMAGAFVSEIVEGTVRGMLGTLKGYDDGGAVEIRLGDKRGATRRGADPR